MQLCELRQAQKLFIEDGLGKDTKKRHFQDVQGYVNYKLLPVFFCMDYYG